MNIEKRNRDYLTSAKLEVYGVFGAFNVSVLCKLDATGRSLYEFSIALFV